MLTLIRQNGQRLVIGPSSDIDPDTTIRDLFKDGPITIVFQPHRGGRRTKLTIHAPQDLKILRFDAPISTFDNGIRDD